MVAVFIVFKGTSILSSRVAVPLYIPTDRVGRFLMCAVLSHLGVVIFHSRHRKLRQLLVYFTTE